MAKHYIIKRWQAKELFVKLVTKFEERHREKNERGDLSRKSVLDFKLKHYGTFNKSKDFADKELKPLGVGEKGYWHYPGVLRDLSRTVVKGNPLALTESRLGIIFGYIGAKADELAYYDEIQIKSKGQEALFEGTTWFLYFIKPYIENGEDRIGVCRVVMRLAEYNFMTIDSIEVDKTTGDYTKDLLYKGQYYTKGDQYLFIEGRVDNTRELRIIFNISLNVNQYNQGDAILGYYLNASTNVYYGPVLIEKTSNDALSSDYRIFKYKEHLIDGERIHEEIWNVLSKDYDFTLPRQISFKKDDLSMVKAL